MTRGGDELYAELRGFFADEKLYRITGALAHNRDAVIAILNKALAEHKRAALEEACKIVCGPCEGGLERTRRGNTWFHYSGIDVCAATPIYRHLEHLAQQGDTKEGTRETGK